MQHGDRLLLVWKYGTPYPSGIYGRYMFHDVGLALVDPIAKTVDVTSLVDDVKYNSSPDVTRHNGRLVYVYNKFEHLYGSRTDPGKLYGCFIGLITPATVSVYLWRWLYRPTGGVFNSLLMSIGLPSQPFMASPKQALWKGRGAPW